MEAQSRLFLGQWGSAIVSLQVMYEHVFHWMWQSRRATWRSSVDYDSPSINTFCLKLRYFLGQGDCASFLSCPSFQMTAWSSVMSSHDVRSFDSSQPCECSGTARRLIEEDMYSHTQVFGREGYARTTRGCSLWDWAQTPDSASTYQQQSPIEGGEIFNNSNMHQEGWEAPRFLAAM